MRNLRTPRMDSKAKRKGRMGCLGGIVPMFSQKRSFGDWIFEFDRWFMKLDAWPLSDVSDKNDCDVGSPEPKDRKSGDLVAGNLNKTENGEL